MKFMIKFFTGIYTTRRYPQHGEIIEITNIKKNKHLIGSIGEVYELRNDLLKLYCNGKLIIISIKEAEIKYKFKNKEYKLN